VVGGSVMGKLFNVNRVTLRQAITPAAALVDA
jgi:hypothetical protein